MIVFLNGRYVSDKKPLISIFDHGFLYGDGIYETLRVYNGEPFLLDDHLRRLKQSAKKMSLKIPPTSFERSIKNLLKKNRLLNAVVRIMVTRGPGPLGFDYSSCKKPTVLITTTPLPSLPKKNYDHGVTVAVVKTRRNHPKSVPPSMKSNNGLNGILAKAESLKMGAHEGLMLDLDGFVAEGTVSNIFCVKNGILYTPSLTGNLLPGVTRAWIIKQAKRANIRVRETKITLSQLLSSDEVFLSNSLIEIWPVKELRGPKKRRFKPCPGLKTRFLMRNYKKC